jgi:signal transduction histidine kinase
VIARVTSMASGHRLTVVDEGPGLSDDDKARATQRFWRGDTSRPGTGLGLSIVDSLARASDAAVVLEDAPRGGLAVSITFAPAAAPVS